MADIMAVELCIIQQLLVIGAKSLDTASVRSCQITFIRGGHCGLSTWGFYPRHFIFKNFEKTV